MPQHVCDGVDDHWVKRLPAQLPQLSQRPRCGTLARRESLLQGEAPGEDATRERYLLAAQPVRLALAVPSLAKEADDDRHGLEPWHVHEALDDVSRRRPAEAPAGVEAARARRHVELRER